MKLKTTNFSIVITREKNSMKLSEAIADYIVSRTGLLSPHTLIDYSLTFRRALQYFEDDPDVAQISSQNIERFLKTVPGNKKNKLNAHIALSSLWTYLIKQEILEQHVVKKVEMARPDQVVVVPFLECEAQRLVQAAATSQNGRRDLAIVKVLLDTGIRASELVGLKIDDLNGTYLTVFGKGSKYRRVPISSLTINSVMEYLCGRKAAPRKAALFESSSTKRALSRYSLDLLCIRLGQRAQVKHVYPHRFRHTFAINYLMNGGDAYTLQDILGHSSMDMVKRYLNIADRDLAKAHLKASPVSNWHL